MAFMATVESVEAQNAPAAAGLAAANNADVQQEVIPNPGNNLPNHSVAANKGEAR